MNTIKKLGRKSALCLSLLSILLTTSCSDIDELEAEVFDINPVPLGENWRMFINHVHTIYSEDNPEYWLFKSKVSSVIRRADVMATASGTDAAIAITDHRTIEALFDPDFVPVGNAIPIIGEEWGNDGHANTIGFSGDTPITDGSGAADYEAMITETHDRGGIVIVNHPGSWESDRALGVDGIEVLNGPAWTTRNLIALDWWQRLLVAGEQITAVGGTDSHFMFHPIQLPINLVNAPSNSQEDILSAVVSGHLMIVQSSATTRVLLTADLDNDGIYDDAMMGDEFTVSTPQTVSFELRLEGAPSQRHQLRLIDRNGPFYEEPIESGPEWDGSTYRFTRTFLANEKNFVRAELLSRNDTIGIVCLTNPIYAVGTDTSEYTEASLQGVVTLAGAAIEGVTIEIRPFGTDPNLDINEVKPGGDSRVASASDGSYSMILPHGIYTVAARIPGSEPQVIVDRVVIDDGDVTLDLVL